MELKEFRTECVYDPKTGRPILFDMYIDEVWYGSKREILDCYRYFNWCKNKKKETSNESRV